MTISLAQYYRQPPANMHKWGLASSPLWRLWRAAMTYIVDLCPITKLDGGLFILHEADVDAINWLKTTATKALAK